MNNCWKTLWIYVLTSVALLVCVKICSATVSTSTVWDDSEAETCIVIDPGHGGEDGGAVSCSGVPESTYNLAISHRLKDMMNLLGYKTVMVRNSDTAVYTQGETLAQKKASDLKERVKLVNNTGRALFVSIHQNYFSDSRYSGAQVFYASTEGSEQLAKELQNEFVSKLNPGSRREAKKSSGIYVMERIQCPGILVECGFLSNPQEEQKLRDPEYQKMLSVAIATTVGRYLSNT
jgi:N-acetylmuramoyl-L-alanine amidase